MDSGPAIVWRDWSTEAFAAARAAGRPVLLSIGTTWSAACRAMHRDVFADAAVAALVMERAVPIRIDADRRPDIADRYDLGGWPTTGLLTPDGALLCGGTFVDAARLTRAVSEAADAFTARREEIERRAIAEKRARLASSGGSATADVDRRAPEHATRCLLDAFDRDWAGWGRGSKAPLVAPLAFALAHRSTAEAAPLVEMAALTLERLCGSELSDPDGAFNRGCHRRDWTAPDTARLLAVQADLIGLLVDASVAFGEARYLERARAAMAYVDRTLADREHGGFFNSVAERAANGREEPGGQDGVPDVDRVLVTDANARMVRAYLRASHVCDDPEPARFAVRTIERLIPAVYAPGAGVAHYLEPSSSRDSISPAAVSGSHASVSGRSPRADVPRVRGLLADQVEVSAALLDVAVVTGDRVYLELAEELMRSCLRKLWDPAGGGFVDRVRTKAGAGDVGLLGEPVKPYGVNCEATRVLARLGRETGDGSLRERAHATLASQTRAYRQQGVLSADYALALLEIDSSPPSSAR